MVPKVSINIRTYNSANTIADTLLSVKNQTYKNFEILVSDGHSNDESVKIAKKFGAIINYADKLGDARYKNYKKSKGEFILSLDSDQILDKRVVEMCVKMALLEKIDAITISEKSFIDKKSTFLQKLIAFDKSLIDKNMDDDPTFGTACPRFFRKDLLDKISWPPELTIFDDTILYSEILKKGARVKYLSKFSIYHREVGSWWVLMKKFFRYGKGYVTALGKKPQTIIAHSLPRRSYFSKDAFAKPLYLLGLLFLYVVKASSAGCGAIYYLLFKK